MFIAMHVDQDVSESLETPSSVVPTLVVPTLVVPTLVIPMLQLKQYLTSMYDCMYPFMYIVIDYLTMTT